MAKKKKILIVDDQQLILNMLTDLLKPDYKIMVAESGNQAFKMAISEAPPDLILLDNMLPDLDGREMCRRFKDNKATTAIPVIFITEGGGENRAQSACLEIGAVDYIIKPIYPPIVQARVRTQLALKSIREQLQKANRVIESHKSKMADELNVCQKIQLSMVPSEFPAFPEHDEFNVYAVLQPASEFGGDFYDFFFIGEDRFCFWIGDVFGKGVQATSFMSVTKSIIKSRAGDDFSTASILTHLNEELSTFNKDTTYATLFIGILNIKTGMMLYTNAGHKPPYLRPGKGFHQKAGPYPGSGSGQGEGFSL